MSGDRALLTASFRRPKVRDGIRRVKYDKSTFDVSGSFPDHFNHSLVITCPLLRELRPLVAQYNRKAKFHSSSLRQPRDLLGQLPAADLKPGFVELVSEIVIHERAFAFGDRCFDAADEVRHKGFIHSVSVSCVSVASLALKLDGRRSLQRAAGRFYRVGRDANAISPFALPGRGLPPGAGVSVEAGLACRGRALRNTLSRPLSNSFAHRAAPVACFRVVADRKHRAGAFDCVSNSF